MSLPRSITSGHTGTDDTDDSRVIITTCPISTIRSMRRPPASAGSIEGICMVSRTSPTSSDRELRCLIEKHVAQWKHWILEVCYIFERSGAKIVNNSQFLGIAS